MERILKKLSEKNGNAVPLACAIVIALLLVSSVIMEYIRLNVIAGGVRDALQASILSVSTGNFDETYNGLREGYSGGYNRNGEGSWDEWLDEGDIYLELDELLGLTQMHAKVTGEREEYQLSDLQVTLINSPLAPTGPEAVGRFEAEAQITIEISLSFGWSIIPALKMTIKTAAGYTPKF